MKWNFLYQITAASRNPDQGATAPRSPFSLSSTEFVEPPPTPNEIPGYEFTPGIQTGTIYILRNEFSRLIIQLKVVILSMLQQICFIYIYI